MYRTHRCNEIRENHIGMTVELAGWVDVVRDHGGVLFVDLRDETGITQVVVHDEKLLKGISKETVISVHGTVSKRDESTVNPKIETGLVELIADDLKVLGVCSRDLPFEIGSNDTNENKTVSVNKGDGFCQGIFTEYFITYDDEAETKRNGGFGSTTK